MNYLRLGMGGLVVLLRSEDLSFAEVAAAYRPFVVADGRPPDLVADFEALVAGNRVPNPAEAQRLRAVLAERIRLYHAGLPGEEETVRRRVDAAARWLSCPPFVECLQSYRAEGEWALLGLSPAGAWFLDRGVARARVFAGAGPAATGAPLLMGHFYLLLRSLLARHDGILLHAAAVVDGDQAYVFVGPSGSGKTTLALAARGLGWAVLADDQAIVRQAAGGEYRAYPTPWNMDRDPWNGSFGRRPESAPVRSIVFIRAGRADRCRRLAPLAAASRLVGGGLPAMRYEERADASRLLGVLAGLGSRLPAYDLCFSHADAALLQISELDGKGENEP